MMDASYMKERIKDFVRNTLGCQCPPEVFDTLDCVDNFTVADGTVVKARINAGNRLLVYVVELSAMRDIDYVMALLMEGRGERDRRGFNRFRLALCCEDREGALLMLKDITPLADGRGSSLEAVEGLDDKVHAHVLAPGSF